MRKWSRWIRGTSSIQRKLLTIFVTVSIPLIALLYAVHHISESTILDHVEEINDMRMAETSSNIRDMMNRAFMSTNLFIGDARFIEALEIEDRFDIQKLNTYFNAIDRLQYAIFLNEKYAVAVIDKYGNPYLSDPSRMNVTKAALQRAVDELLPQQPLDIMDSYRWHSLRLSTAEPERNDFLALSRVVFNPQTASPKGHVVIFLPMAYIETILLRQQGLFEIRNEAGETLIRTGELPASLSEESAERYPLEPTNWTLYYWKDQHVIAQNIALFRLTTWIAIGTIVAIMIGVTVVVINEIRKALLQIRSLSRQLALNEENADVHIKADYHIVELSHTLKQLVHNLNATRKNYEAAAFEKKELEMQMLQHQINPHFLLNTLNTFRWLAESAKQEKLGSLMLALSHMLSQQLYDNKRAYWTVGEELDYLNKYVEIQKTRYGENIAVFFQAEDGVERGRILKMLLQPILENCFEHAFAGREAGSIRIRIRDAPNGLKVAIEDDGCGYEEPPPDVRVAKSSIGLDNVRSRISLHYGPSSLLRIERPAAGGTRVVFVLQGGEPSLE